MAGLLRRSAVLSPSADRHSPFTGLFHVPVADVGIHAFTALLAIGTESE